MIIHPLYPFKMDALPAEIFTKIFSYLHPIDRLEIAPTSRLFCSITDSIKPRWTRYTGTSIEYPVGFEPSQITCLQNLIISATAQGVFMVHHLGLPKDKYVYFYFGEGGDSADDEVPCTYQPEKFENAHCSYTVSHLSSCEESIEWINTLSPWEGLWSDDPIQPQKYVCRIDGQSLLKLFDFPDRLPAYVPKFHKFIHKSCLPNINSFYHEMTLNKYNEPMDFGIAPNGQTVNADGKCLIVRNRNQVLERVPLPTKKSIKKMAFGRRKGDLTTGSEGFSNRLDCYDFLVVTDGHRAIFLQ